MRVPINKASLLLLIGFMVAILLSVWLDGRWNTNPDDDIASGSPAFYPTEKENAQSIKGERADVARQRKTGRGGALAHPVSGTSPSAGASEEQKRYRTAQRLAAFLASGDVNQLRAIGPNEAIDYARTLANEYGGDEIARLGQKFFSLPDEMVPRDEGQLQDYLLNWFYALRGDSGEENNSASINQRPVPVAFVTNVFGPMSSAGSFPAGTRCIYGIFENAGDTAGLNWVMAVWRDLSTGRIAFQECEPIRANTPFNYVWLDLPSGWPVGYCQLELLDPNASFRLLGQGRFHIQERKDSL